MNAIRHGLRSRNVVLSTESAAEWEQLYQLYSDRFQPADQIEVDLIHQIVAARWRQERAWTIESAAFEAELQARDMPLPEQLQESPALRVALAFHGESPEAKSLATLPLPQDLT